MNTETATMISEPALHRELLDKLAERFPEEASVAAGWCDIRDSLKVGTVYTGSNGIGRLGASFRLTLNPDGTVKIMTLHAIGKDFTAEVKANGGDSIPVKYSRHAHNCQTSNYYHGWELHGSTIQWMAKLVSDYTGGVINISEPTLFSRYQSHGDPKKWLAFNYGIPTWLWTDLAF